MARAALTTLTLLTAGTDIADEFEAIGADGVALDNTTGYVALLIENGAVSSATITIDVPTVVDGNLVVPDRTYTIPAGETWIFRPFSRSVYNQDDAESGLDQAVLIDSSITDGTVKALAFYGPRG